MGWDEWPLRWRGTKSRGVAHIIDLLSSGLPFTQYRISFEIRRLGTALISIFRIAVCRFSEIVTAFETLAAETSPTILCHSPYFEHTENVWLACAVETESWAIKDGRLL